MVDKEIVNFIKEQRAKNFSDKKIKSALINADFKKKEINKTFKYLSAQQKAISKLEKSLSSIKDKNIKDKNESSKVSSPKESLSKESSSKKNDLKESNPKESESKESNPKESDVKETSIKKESLKEDFVKDNKEDSDYFKFNSSSKKLEENNSKDNEFSKYNYNLEDPKLSKNEFKLNEILSKSDSKKNKKDDVLESKPSKKSKEEEIIEDYIFEEDDVVKSKHKKNEEVKADSFNEEVKKKPSSKPNSSKKKSSVSKEDVFLKNIKNSYTKKKIPKKENSSMNLFQKIFIIFGLITLFVAIFFFFIPNNVFSISKVISKFDKILIDQNKPDSITPVVNCENLDQYDCFLNSNCTPIYENVSGYLVFSECRGK